MKYKKIFLLLLNLTISIILFGEEPNPSVVYYYLPPEVKITPEERARVMKSLNERLAEKNQNTKSKKIEKLTAKKEKKLQEKITETKQKEQEEFQKNISKFEREEKIKEIEKFLGVQEDENLETSPEMASIINKNAELNKKFDEFMKNNK